MAFITFSRMLSSVSAVMVKGMLRLRMTVRTNMLLALVIINEFEEGYRTAAAREKTMRTVSESGKLRMRKTVLPLIEYIQNKYCSRR